MKHVLFLIACLFLMHGMAQNQTREARVVDAESGEPIPCVGVYIEAGRTTLTNFDGDFSIEADSNEVVRLTCVGYRTLYFASAELPPVVRMEPLTGMMSEVTVRGLEGLLLNISRRMEKEYNRRRTSTAQYFYRQTTVIGRKQDIVEAFIKARSACNLRNLQFTSGRHGTATKEQQENSIFSNMNLHHVLELGAMTKEIAFWDGLITPLLSPKKQYVIRSKGKTDRIKAIELYQKFYDIDVKEIADEERKMLRIEMKRREDVDEKVAIMTGTLYVDANTLQALAFDGQVENMVLQFRPSELESIINVPVNLSLHIDYRHDHGFAEVADIGMQTRFENFQTRTMLFNFDENRPSASKVARVDENMLASIDKVRYDSILWATDNIIKRTKEEESIAKGFIVEDEAKRDSAIKEFNSLPSLKRLAERARLLGERIPQEKVYVHMDNTCYFLGDTLWFSAYTRRTNSGRPSRISRVLYAELWNHDGFLVERKLVEMRDGRGSGFFALPDTLYSGFFELRAYTRWQLNWGQTEHPHSRYTERNFYNKAMARDFFRDYEKLYSRVFPVYDKPKEEGVFTRNMTLRPLRRYFKSDPDKPQLLLSLYPEGGDMVEGLPCRMAFEAAMQDGEARDGRLQLMCADSLVTTAETEHRGRGSLTFTPEPGRKYRAVFTTADSSLTVSEKLKDIEKLGVAVKVERIDSTWNITVHSNLKDTPLGLTVMHEGITSHFMQLKDEKITFGNDELPAGVNQLTVFDGQGRVWADRLFFVTKPDLGKPTISFSGLKDLYEPYEQVELEAASASPSATISLAVRDKALQDNTYDTGNIMTEMLLASEIKGFVPQPQWYFERDDEEHRRGLDLLMMTQGWRRFHWRDMAVEGLWDITHPAEQTQMLTGSVNYYYHPVIEDEEDEGDFIRWLELHEEKTKNILEQTKIQEQDKKLFFIDETDQTDKMNRRDRSQLPRLRYEFVARHKNGGRVKREVKVHAEFVHPDNPKDCVVGEATTNNGCFKLDVPRFYGNCIFFLTAKDTTLWTKKIRKLWMKKFRQHNWVQMEDDEYERIHEDAEFYVQLNFPYPRWVKPYTYYQTNEAPLRGDSPARAISDDKLLDEVVVRGRRNGRRRLDLSKPVYVVDAYEAANAAMDAGLTSDIYYIFTPDNPYIILAEGQYYPQSPLAQAIAYNYVSDMGMDRDFPLATFVDSVRIAGYGVYVNPNIAPGEYKRYNRLEYIDKVYIYSDYSPRMEGSKRYSQDDQPSVEVSLHKYPDNSRRVTYRDRRYVLPGFAYQEDFYHPDYRRNPPQDGQKDYRRTLYWNPALQLDEQGRARISFFNNSRHNQLQLEAEGMDGDGKFLCK